MPNSQEPQKDISFDFENSDSPVFFFYFLQSIKRWQYGRPSLVVISTFPSVERPTFWKTY